MTVMENIKYSKFDPSGAGKYSIHNLLVNFTGKNKKVLEIGCATGYISRKLKENGCEVIGLEIDEESVRIAGSICDRIICGDIEIIQLPDEKFDVILLGDVLEHLKNPQKILRKLVKNLKSDGRVIISIPNVAHLKIRAGLLFGRFNYTKDGILDESHLRFFTYKSITNLIKSAGLKIENEDLSPGIQVPFLPIFLKYKIAKLWKTMFALQFLFVCKK